jgi:S-adenosylmethionine/arginine decarboxylase-like enzyme
MENLGYGTHFTVDGFQADDAALTAEGAALNFLKDVAAYLEPGEGNSFQAVAQGSNGESAALIVSESQLLLHAFPDLRSVSLQVFTRRDVSLTQLMTLLEQAFDAGRFESHLGNVARTAPTDKDELERMVQGDRAYARARLTGLRSG